MAGKERTVLRTAFNIIALTIAAKAVKEVTEFIVKDHRQFEAWISRKATDQLLRDVEGLTPSDYERIMDGPILTSGMNMPPTPPNLH